jgi:hypothetical protein
MLRTKGNSHRTTDCVCASGVTPKQSEALFRCRQRPSNQILINMEGSCHTTSIADNKLVEGMEKQLKVEALLETLEKKSLGKEGTFLGDLRLMG